jgi:acyl-coenzyme A thioesterase 9
MDDLIIIRVASPHNTTLYVSISLKNKITHNTTLESFRTAMDLNVSPSNNSTITIPVNGTIPVSSTFENPIPVTGSRDRKPIALWPGMFHSPVTTALWEARGKIFERLLDPPRDAPPQSELVTRTPSQSRTSILYNFSSDFVLREQYRDPWNDVRIGKLLEDLDALAGTISVKVPCHF